MIPILLAVALLGVAAYFILTQLTLERQRKNRLAALANAYQQLIVQNRLLVDHYEINGNRVLVFDRQTKKLIAIDHNRHAKQEICIPLLSVSETKVVEEKCREGYVQRIFLLLKHKWSEVVYRICFFDRRCDDTVELPSSTRRALVWKNRIDMHKYPGPVHWGQEFVL